MLDLAEFRARFATYRHVFHDGEVAYAGKALVTRAVARIVDHDRLSLDVCSEGELALATDVRFPADRIILHGNAKPASLLRRAMPLGVGRIVVDSLDEISTLAAVAVAFGPGRQRVLLCIAPGVDAHTHRAVTTGTDDQSSGCRSASSTWCPRFPPALADVHALYEGDGAGPGAQREDPLTSMITLVVVLTAVAAPPNHAAAMTRILTCSARSARTPITPRAATCACT